MKVDQPGLFDAPQHMKAQRHSPTSIAAGESMRPKVGKLHAQVIDLIRERGPLTDEQIADALHMNPSTARPRRVELVERRLLVQVGTAPTRSGRQAVQWDLIERAPLCAG